MRTDLAEKLFNDFPALFPRGKQEGRPQDPFRLFGFEVLDGWYDLIYGLAASITAHAEQAGLQPGPQVAQVKEKFGTLRFYLYGADDTIEDLVEAAERASENICEQCGQPGQLRMLNDWYLTRCEIHAEGAVVVPTDSA